MTQTGTANPWNLYISQAEAKNEFQLPTVLFGRAQSLECPSASAEGHSSKFWFCAVCQFSLSLSLLGLLLQNMNSYFHAASSSFHVRIHGARQHPCHSRGFWLQAVSPDAGRTHCWQKGAHTLEASKPQPLSNAAKRQEHALELHRVNIPCVGWGSAARTHGQAYHHSNGSNESTDSEQGLVDGLVACSSMTLQPSKAKLASACKLAKSSEESSTQDVQSSAFREEQWHPASQGFHGNKHICRPHKPKGSRLRLTA